MKNRFKIKDLKQAVDILYDQWNLGKIECGATGKICAWIYLFELLAIYDRMISFRKNGKLIGFSGYSKKNSKKHLIRKKVSNLIVSILFKSKDIKDVQALKDYGDNYEYIPNSLWEQVDGELVMLIVDKKYRGKHIGRKLLHKIFKLAQQDGLKSIVIQTDESCNYRFYESCGCRKVFEKTIENKEHACAGKENKEQAFIYIKNLKENEQ